MLKIISALTYLTRQGLAMRKGNAEFDSNFYQLLKAWAKDDPILTKWLEKKRENFTGHEIQNEILMLMAHHITRDILKDIKEAKHFTYMSDETSDIANIEQVFLCLRWVDDNFEVHEDYLELMKAFRCN